MDEKNVTVYVPADSLVRREETREPPSNARWTVQDGGQGCSPGRKNYDWLAKIFTAKAQENLAARRVRWRVSFRSIPDVRRDEHRGFFCLTSTHPVVPQSGQAGVFFSGSSRSREVIRRDRVHADGLLNMGGSSR